jgi:hypothetical protein
MIFGDLLKISKWMAILALLLCTLATAIAYFSLSLLEPLVLPLMVIGVFVWVLSAIWFLWGWLKTANEESSERKGVSASSYILAFLPVCYCFLMATDEARTKISVSVRNEWAPVYSVKVYATGTIFLKNDTLKLAGLAKGESLEYENKASTSPHMRGDIRMSFFRDNKKYIRRVAGPFSINPMALKQDWEYVLNEAE